MNAIPIRLALTTRSSPPTFPVDQNTGETARIFRGEDVSIQVAVFDQGTPLDLSNITLLEFMVFPFAVPPRDVGTNYSYAPYTQVPYPSSYPAPLINVPVEAVDITAYITDAEWQAGGFQAEALLSWIDTQNLSLDGLPVKDFWLVIQGWTGTRKLTYAATPLRVYESGAQGVYLPNTVAPLDVPLYTTLLVPPNQQLLFSTTISVEGQVDVEGQLVQL